MYFIFSCNIKILNCGSYFPCICKSRTCTCYFLFWFFSFFFLHAIITIFVHKYRIFVLSNDISIFFKGVLSSKVTKMTVWGRIKNIKNGWNDGWITYQTNQKVGNFILGFCIFAGSFRYLDATSIFCCQILVS